MRPELQRDIRALNASGRNPIEVVAWGTAPVHLAYSQSDIHVDQALTDYAISFLDDLPYIADLAMPFVDVTKESDKFWKWLNEETARVPNTLRARGNEAKTVEFATVVDQYSALEYALKAWLSVRDLQNADEGLDFQRNHVRALQKLIRKDRELRVRDILTTPTNYPADHQIPAPPNTWDLPTSDDPRITVEAAMDAVAKAIEGEANLMIISRQVRNALRRNPHVTEQVKYTSRTTSERVTLELLAEFFDIEQVAMAGAVFETQKKGTPSVPDWIWPKDVVILKVDPNPNRESNHFGSSFATRRARVRSWFEDKKEIEENEVSMVVVEKIANNAAGAIIEDVIQ